MHMDYAFTSDNSTHMFEKDITELSFPLFHDIHLAPKTSVIYNSIVIQLYSRRSPGWRYYKSFTQNLRHLQFRDVYLAPKNFVLHNSSNSQASLYPTSQISQSIYYCLPSPLPSHPSQCTWIMLLLVTTQHKCSKKIGIALLGDNSSYNFERISNAH
jgi:hypothetical protein